MAWKQHFINMLRGFGSIHRGAKTHAIAAKRDSLHFWNGQIEEKQNAGQRQQEEQDRSDTWGIPILLPPLWVPPLGTQAGQS